MNMDLIGQIIAVIWLAGISAYVIYNFKLQDEKYGTLGSPKK